MSETTNGPAYFLALRRRRDRFEILPVIFEEGDEMIEGPLPDGVQLVRIPPWITVMRLQVNS